MKVSCVIVTYNRKELLQECLEAVLNQTYEVNKIYVIDNNSTDGTYLLFTKENILSDRIEYIKLNENLGGAGGFEKGMKNIDYSETDWVWIMDDDTIPTNTALEELLNCNEKLKDEKVSFLCSKVVDINGKEMNIPIPSDRAGKNGYKLWAKYINDKIVEVKMATFVSILVKADAVKKVGLPWSKFFIWGDDTEYTLRLNKYYGPGFLAGASLVIHKRTGGANIDIFKEDNLNRLNLYKFKYRNDLIIAKEYHGVKRVARLLVRDMTHIFRCIFSAETNKGRKIKSILSGVNNFVFDKYRKDFNNRMNFKF